MNRAKIKAPLVSAEDLTEIKSHGEELTSKEEACQVDRFQIFATTDALDTKPRLGGGVTQCPADGGKNVTLHL